MLLGLNAPYEVNEGTLAKRGVKKKKKGRRKINFKKMKIWREMTFIDTNCFELGDSFGGIYCIFLIRLERFLGEFGKVT